MAIGYYNYSPLIAQGEQTVNQLAGLGQQIGQAIETHAATQSAQAMLPAIQSQYANGIQKISDGDSSGIADITQAAGLAGQNPLTSHLSNQMINSATQANENYRNKLLTDTRLQTAGLGYQGKIANLAGRYPGLIDTSTGQINQNWQPPAKQLDPDKLMKGVYTATQLQMTYQSAMDQAEKNGDPDAYKAAAQKLNDLNSNATKLGMTPTGMPLTYDAAKKATDITQKLNTELQKPTSGIKSWLGGQDKSKIDSYNKQLEELHKDPNNHLGESLVPQQKQTSQLPSAQSNADQMQGSQNQSPNVISVDEASKALKRPVKAGTILTDKDGNQITVQ